jgi:hypothetical protein
MITNTEIIDHLKNTMQSYFTSEVSSQDLLMILDCDSQLYITFNQESKLYHDVKHKIKKDFLSSIIILFDTSKSKSSLK